MDSNTPGAQLPEEPQSERGETGSRDTGSDKPGGGPAERAEGAIESVPSHGGTAEDANLGGPGTMPPQDTGSAVPPYEGRQKTAKPFGDQASSEKGGARTGGAGRPVEDSQYKSAAPGETERGATAAPGDEQPAAEQSESERGYDTTGPAHTPGVGQGENKR